MNDSQHFYKVFTQCIDDYQYFHDADRQINNPFIPNTLDHLLYQKNWTDQVQWDLEDLIRDPDILPEKALQLKRRIDASNQRRTDLVEKIDDFFLETYKQIAPQPGARLNTESIAWALDRLSILALKIFHMNKQVLREDADETHRQKCVQKLEILQIQQRDLMQAINELLEDMAKGNRIIKVYRQMKMYNDPTLNPVLYGQKK